MTNSHENKLTMYEAVHSLLEANKEKTAGLPAFAGSIASFRESVQSIKGKSREVDEAATGRTAAKNQAEDELVSVVIPVASALFVHAGAQKDLPLREKASVSETSLRRLRDTELASKASSMLSLANERATALGTYGITPAMLNDLQVKITTFSGAIGERESGVAERVGARVNLFELFDVADKTLSEELDPLMELVRGSQRQFYNEYFAARVIKDLGTRHRPAQEGTAKPNP